MSLPKTLGNCTQMDEFNVEGNNITQLPVSTSSHFSVVTMLRVLNTWVLVSRCLETLFWKSRPQVLSAVGLGFGLGFNDIHLGMQYIV